MPLKLSRRAGESIQIGDAVTVTVSGLKNNRVILSIDAPAGIVVRLGQTKSGRQSPREVTGSMAISEHDTLPDQNRDLP